MKLKLAMTTVTSPASIDVRDMKDTQFAVVTSHEPFTSPFHDGLRLGPSFVGEIIYRDYAGWHGLTGDRFWPSTGRVYIPKMRVRPLEAGELLEVTD